MIRILLVDDQHLVRMGLRMLCESAPDLEVVGEAADGRDVQRLVTELQPDVVLMDLRMPGVDGITATRRIMQARPASRVVALTTFGDDDHLYPALAAGAFGFLVKDSPPEELLAAIRKAAAGEQPFSQAVLGRLVDQAVRARSPQEAAVPAHEVPELTGREREVLAMVGAGLSNGEIADRLHLGVTTVKTHVASLMRKTGCPNRIRLAVLAVQTGVTPQ
ncbi:DNA-binding response regulator, NarL/FixJ family, contains REC and HTH domains [Thermomonospora echinospora]|uniref:DNA-binding response regulator, NarL/FixJ family, contains REC and HTH domains n=1 Tax=Thermomonospora echinospora TaxID=1992 RepID=A0A1H5VD89_9ACTN|nr:response regulator transcription factor [Thermomonospora echinospora]SEF85174.1 DNA-binding response regulator, NarL/FixJ family, contains REC and HTH domains [Thermomonospora echinospora]